MSAYLITDQLPCPECGAILTIDAFDLQDGSISCQNCWEIIHLDDEEYQDKGGGE